MPLPSGGGASGGGSLDDIDLRGGRKNAEPVLSGLVKDVAYQEAVWLGTDCPVGKLAELHGRKWSDRDADPKRVRREPLALEKKGPAEFHEPRGVRVPQEPPGAAQGVHARAGRLVRQGDQAAAPGGGNR